MKKLLITIRYKLKYGLSVEWYNLLYVILWKKLKITPKVASIDDTILRIVNEKCSASRFGDGEMLLIGNKPIRFQKNSTELSERLKEVFMSENSNHLVCISDAFYGLNRYNRKARRFWRTNLYLYGSLWENYLREEREYYNTFMTRPYMDFKNKDKTADWFVLLKKIWEGRDIVFVEGEKSRLGYGNDLFDNALSIKRILCPATDAFEKYPEILKECLKQNKNQLFLIALGPTATVLAYDLWLNGYQAVDVGHVDVEYEWFRMGVTRKVPIPTKYVNEAPSGNIVTKGEDENFKSQVICRI